MMLAPCCDVCEPARRRGQAAMVFLPGLLIEKKGQQLRHANSHPDVRVYQTNVDLRKAAISRRGIFQRETHCHLARSARKGSESESR